MTTPRRTTSRVPLRQSLPTVPRPVSPRPTPPTAPTTLAPSPTGASGPRPPTTTPAPATNSTGTADQRDALAYIQSILRQYGLPDSLSEWAWGEILHGKSQNEVILDLYDRPEFKATFPEIDMRRNAGLEPMSPGDIVSYRNNARQIAHAAGLPTGFYDNNEDFTKLIAGNVSISEFADRVKLAQEAAFGVPKEVRDALGQLGIGDFTALAFDGNTALPLLEHKLKQAEAIGAAQRGGYGGLNTAEVNLVADQGLTFEQMQAGFGALADAAPLFTPIDPSEDVITRGEQLSAAFTGSSGARRRIETRRQQRLATFASGGGLAETGQGVAGLGTSST